MKYNRPSACTTLRGFIVCVAAIAVCLCISLPECSGAAFADQVSQGTGSRKAKQQALAAVPYDQLNQETLAKIQPVLDRPGIYRKLPVSSIDVDPDYFVFLTRHPEVIVGVWKLMGITQMSTTRTGPFTIRTNDGSGTLSDIELVYGTRNLHIFYGQGSYTGNVIKRELNGRAVVIVQTQYSTGADGQQVATSQLDVFIKVDNTTATMLARTLTPLVGPTADHNFVETLNFVERLNETTVKNGPGVQRMAERLEDVDPEVRQTFGELAGQVYQRGGMAARNASLISPRDPSPYDSYSSGVSSAEPQNPVRNPAGAAQTSYMAPGAAIPSASYPSASYPSAAQIDPRYRPAAASSVRPQPYGMPTQQTTPENLRGYNAPGQYQQPARSSDSSYPPVGYQQPYRQTYRDLQNYNASNAHYQQNAVAPANYGVAGYPAQQTGYNQSPASHAGSLRQGASATSWASPEYNNGVYRR